jgi:hypothetical protein
MTVEMDWWISPTEEKHKEIWVSLTNSIYESALLSHPPGGTRH